MRVVTQEVNVYNFTDVETNEVLKAEVLKKHADINLGHDWYEPTYEGIKDQLTPYGYSDIEIRFSGFYSQGDGASITGKINAIEWLDKMKETNDSHYSKYRRVHELMKKGFIFDFIGEIKRDKYLRYVHEQTTSLYFKFYVHSERLLTSDLDTLFPNVHELLNELVEDIHNHHVMCNKNAYTELMKQYEYATESEQVLDTLKCNRYEFTEDGNIFTEN